MKKNSSLRETVRNSGVHWWEIADELHIPPEALSRSLRYDLPEEQKQKILDAIEKIKVMKAEQENEI